MNLFKVLASGKKPMFEEQASALLAWLMNPLMEHGMGFQFLLRFLGKLEGNSPELKQLKEELVLQLRTQETQKLKWCCILEDSVNNAFIDLVFVLNNTVLAVENKIYAGSASDETQLIREYEGLRNAERYEGHRIDLIFLIPWNKDEGEDLDPRIKAEHKAILDYQNKFKAGDRMHLMTWQEHKEYPSVYGIIQEILQDESVGRIEPISEYTRHTLKALNSFIGGNFEGYYYDKSSGRSGNNPLTESKVATEKLMKMMDGYVGVKSGIDGLIRYDPTKLEQARFQYTTNGDIEGRPQWMTVQEFKAITGWLLGNSSLDFTWDHVLSAQSICRLIAEVGTEVYIGIQGGKNALSNMKMDEIRKKRWQIRTTASAPTAQWISGTEMKAVLTVGGLYDELRA